MVKLGFIVEGYSEKIVVESKTFKKWLVNNGISIAHPVINAEGGGNLLPKHLKEAIQRLTHQEVDHIVILTDLECEPDEDAVRQRIGNQYTNLIFIAVKALEAWYLADTEAMRKWLKVDSFYENKPQETPAMPWDRLGDIAKELNKRGTGPSKPKFAKIMVDHCGFDVVRAAQHPHCPSAKAFHDGLLALAESA